MIDGCCNVRLAGPGYIPSVGEARSFLGDGRLVVVRCSRSVPYVDGELLPETVRTPFVRKGFSSDPETFVRRWVALELLAKATVTPISIVVRRFGARECIEWTERGLSEPVFRLDLDARLVVALCMRVAAPMK